MSLSTYQLTILLIGLCACLSQVSASSIPVDTTPVSFKHGISKALRERKDGISKAFGARYEQAKSLAALEQEVEDFNAQWVASAKDMAQSTSRRRLICLPLDDRFDPPMGSFSHKHVQTGDKMSLPHVFFEAIKTNLADVPWLYSVSRVEGVSMERVEVLEDLAAEHLHEVVGGPLDYRAPANYIFLPWWMMRSLGLQPRDVVDVKLITTVAPGSLAKLRPHSSKFAKEIANTQAVLETELKHYSSLTKGSTIAFDYNGNRYWFDVVELRSAPRGEKQPMVKLQDCDVATDFLPAKDVIKKKKKEQEEDE
jgi:ubiquitin fusion degradation protein 1